MIYLTIRHWNCNCQKFHIWLILFQFFLYLTSHFNFILSYLSFFLFSYLVLVTLILSHLLFLNHLTLKLNKSHNILEEARRSQPNFCILFGWWVPKNVCGSIWIAVFTRLILTCQILIDGHFTASWLYAMTGHT